MFTSIAFISSRTATAALLWANRTSPAVSIVEGYERTTSRCLAGRACLEALARPAPKIRCTTCDTPCTRSDSDV